MRLILVRQVEAESEPVSRRHAESVARQIATVARRTLAVEAVYAAPDTRSFDTATVITEVIGTSSATTEEAFQAPAPDSEAESLEQAQLRAWSAVEAIQEQRSPDCSLVLVCSEPTLRLLVCRALAIPIAEMRRFRIEPGSLTTLDFRLQPQRRTILAGLNETCHVGQVASNK